MSEFVIHCNKSQKNHSSTFHSMMFLFHTYWDFFLTDQNISKMGSKRLAVKKTFFVRSETWMIVLLGVNLSLFEIKSFFGTYSAFSFILLSLVFATPLCCAIFPQKRLVHCIIGWDTLISSVIFWSWKHQNIVVDWNCAGLLLKPFVQLLL